MPSRTPPPTRTDDLAIEPCTGCGTSDSDAAGGDPLAAEQQYLGAARGHLRRMREHVLGLEVQGGDRVSSEHLAAALWRRAESLVDDPSTTLFFGRTDHVDGARRYIGRRHVADEAGDPLVVDWRADVAGAFYRAAPQDPMGVTRRRRFGVENGQITAYEDETLAGDGPAAGPDPSGARGRGALRAGSILAREIERPRVGPMRDIVATIQPEQDVIVRAGLDLSVCVQGAPGTGKTAVGLHRAAWLLYAFRERLTRQGVLVVGPNRSFLEHIAAVLPSLGEVEVWHTTALGLVGGEVEALAEGRAAASRFAVGRAEHADAARLKGDVRMAQVLHRAVWGQVVEPTETLVVPRGAYRWRVPAATAREVFAELRARGARYQAARDMAAQRLAHAVLVEMEAAGDSPDDRVQAAVARSKEVRAYLTAHWPATTPEQVLHRLYGDAGWRDEVAGPDLDPAERDLLAWPEGMKVPRTARAARWSEADVVLLDEIADLLQRTGSLGHVVLDEAQDLSPMHLRAVGRRAATGSVTVLGDIAQGTTPWATSGWTEALTHLGHPDAVVEELVRGFRVPGPVIDWAAALLPRIAPGLTAPRSVRSEAGSLDVLRVDDPTALVPAGLEALTAALTGEGSVGLVVADADADRWSARLDLEGLAHTHLGRATAPQDGPVDGRDGGSDGSDDAGPTAAPEPPPRVSVVPAGLAKGLEFDHVVVVEPDAIRRAEPDDRTGLRRLYVVLTRAVTSLRVVHHAQLPRELRRVAS